ncbi:MAG TPA: oligosaccharide flippase family protein, partial [bacterium]|nr:oligosaccharide flippase family protein [bacterium]
ARFFLSLNSYGTFLYVFFIFSIVNNLRDLGISTQVIRRKEINYSLINTLFLVLSLIITILQIIYGLYILPNNKMFGSTLILMALSYIPTALGSAPSIYFARNLLIKKTITARVSSIFLYFVFAVILCYYGFDAAGLAIAKFVQSISFMFMIWLPARKIISVKIEFDGTLNLIKDSYKFFINDNLSLITAEIYNYVIKNFVSTASLAIYRAAHSLIDIPLNIIEQAFFKVAYPLFSQLIDEPKKLINGYTFLTILLLCIEAPLYAYMFFNSEFIIYLTYGAKYDEAVNIIKLLSFLPIFTPCTTFGIELIKSLKKDNLMIAYIFIGSFFIILFSFLLTKNFGITGTAIANYLGMNYFIIYYFLYKNYYESFIYIMKRTPIIYIASFKLFFLSHLLKIEFEVIRYIIREIAIFTQKFSYPITQKISDISHKTNIISHNIIDAKLLVIIFYSFYKFIYLPMKKDLNIRL